MKHVHTKWVVILCGLGVLTMNAMEKSLVQEIKGLPDYAQRQIALSRIGDFLLSQQQPKTLGHDDAVYATSISPDSKHVATASFDKTAKIWNKDGKLEHILRGHNGLVNLITISRDNAYVATGAFDKSEAEIDRTVKIWDMKTGNLVRTLGEKEADRHLTSITALAISPDNKYIVTGSADHMVKVWNMQTGELILSFGGIMPNTPGWTTNWINNIEISSDGNYVLIGANDGKTITFDMKTKQTKEVPRHILNGKVISMAMAGNKLVTGSWDGTAKLWDITNDKLIHSFGQGARKVLSVDISEDGAYVVAAPADDDNAAKVWDANTGQLLCTLGGSSGHTDLIRKVKISRNGKYVATAGRDKTVKVWDRKTCKLLYTFTGHAGEIESLTISPDVTYLVTGSHDRTAKIWSLLLNLNAAEFNQQGQALTWIKQAITYPQADLIARAYDETREGRELEIKPASGDSTVFLSLPVHVRMYLLQQVKIKLDSTKK